MYDPHKTPDMRGEMEVMGNGRLVKARLPDQPAPNVSWFWIPLGNCHACKFYVGTECTNPKISRDDFLHKYMVATDCPEFEAGAGNKDDDFTDVLKAVGLVSGKPSQRVEVIRDLPWTIDAAMTAHREQSTFLRMAHAADRMAASGVANDPDRVDYVDMEDDLEGAVGAVQNSGLPSPVPPPPRP